MKKTLIATILALTTITAHALPSSSGHIMSHRPVIQAYKNGYNNGYDAGKQKAYNDVNKIIFFTTAAVFTGFVIYKIGKNSRWTTTENGVTYRF